MILNKKIAYFIDMCIGTKLPGLIMSTPGMGKTSTIQLWCNAHDYELVTVIASQYSADDILGLQSIKDGELVRLSPAWFNKLMKLHESNPNKGIILFLDEITTCDEFIQAPLLNLIFNRSIGLQQLPDNVTIVSAGNYSDNLNEAFNMTAPLVNRFMILNLTASDVDLSELATGVEPDETLLDYTDMLMNVRVTLKEKLGGCIRFHANLSRVQFENSSEKGLFGFQSIRSVAYCMKAIDWAVREHKVCKFICKIMSDTLGSYKDGMYYLEKLNKLCVQYMLSNDGDNSTVHLTELRYLNSTQLNRYLKMAIDNPSIITESIYQELLSRRKELDINLMKKLAEIVTSHVILNE